MSKALIVCATRTKETLRIGEIIGEGVRMAGQEAVVVNANTIKGETDLQGYDAVVLGSATYHGDMLPVMKTVLFLAEKASLQGKVGGAFGAFGWSGEAPERIFDTMANVFQMNMVSGPLRLKSSTLGGGIQMAQAYGGDVASKMMTAP
jgi:flavorubredoxin